MNCSFTPDGDWFVFRKRDGVTLMRYLKSKNAAISWMLQADWRKFNV
jgi:hypothetical protein